MSRPTQDRAIVDAGLKALAFDSGPPLVCDEPAASYERTSDEHTRLSNFRRGEPAQHWRQAAPLSAIAHLEQRFTVKLNASSQ